MYPGGCSNSISHKSPIIHRWMQSQQSFWPCHKKGVCNWNVLRWPLFKLGIRSFMAFIKETLTEIILHGCMSQSLLHIQFDKQLRLGSILMKKWKQQKYFAALENSPGPAVVCWYKKAIKEAEERAQCGKDHRTWHTFFKESFEGYYITMWLGPAL